MSPLASHQPIQIPLADRASAGQALAGMLRKYRQRRDVLVLGLPRGGVPVAYEIATALDVRLDVWLVRKLGVPDYPELALGAIADAGVRVLNPDVVRKYHLSQPMIELVAARETLELQRRQRVYRGHRPPAQITGQQVIVVDDGLATGASMQAAVQSIQQLLPARVIIAVPVAAADSLELLRSRVDEIVCPFAPDPLYAIGHWYADFTQTSDEQVLQLLHAAWQREARRPAQRPRT